MLCDDIACDNLRWLTEAGLVISQGTLRGSCRSQSRGECRENGDRLSSMPDPPFETHFFCSHEDYKLCSCYLAHFLKARPLNPNVHVVGTQIVFLFFSHST
jgi:hypothetical protein